MEIAGMVCLISHANLAKMIGQYNRTAHKLWEIIRNIWLVLFQVAVRPRQNIWHKHPYTFSNSHCGEWSGNRFQKNKPDIKGNLYRLNNIRSFIAVLMSLSWRLSKLTSIGKITTHFYQTPGEWVGQVVLCAFKFLVYVHFDGIDSKLHFLLSIYLIF